jgi:hypothetical protein
MSQPYHIRRFIHLNINKNNVRSVEPKRGSKQRTRCRYRSVPSTNRYVFFTAEKTNSSSSVVDPDPTGTQIVCKIGYGSVLNFGSGFGYGSSLKNIQI